MEERFTNCKSFKETLLLFGDKYSDSLYREARQFYLQLYIGGVK